MSYESVQKFRELAATDPTLSEALRKIAASGLDLEAVAALGREHGLDLSAEDIIGVFSSDSEELSELELEMVAAGTATNTRDDIKV